MDLMLSEEQIETFLESGYLVVENVLTSLELEAATLGLRRTLLRHGVDTENLRATGHHLKELSSTNGSGGVLDLFYDEWKLDVSTHPKLFSLTTQLWKAAYCHHGEARDEVSDCDTCKWHPYGAFDPSIGYSFIDRIGFRIPTQLAEELGADVTFNGEQPTKMTKKRPTPIQRSLTPHLDCCPDNLFNDKAKWRPIQCFVSLTDNLRENTGGFEVARGGFHKRFHKWAAERPPTTITKKESSGERITISIAAPCVGEYAHIRPKEDRDVMQSVQHVPVAAGSAVLWDNRLPHANAYRHTGIDPRCVVYCSFLPAVPINKQYVAKQLENWKQGRQPTDQWINLEDKQIHEAVDGVEGIKRLNNLQRRLYGIDSWPERCILKPDQYE
jgi:ectoine hydroxylase-related dioxygenase (phytanoyl-CoA dioxygenase family)